VFDIFKGFLALRLLGLLSLAVVVGVVLGIRSLARGSDVVGFALIAAALLLAAGIGLVAARRPRGRSH
jgi:hypothetical protein